MDTELIPILGVVSGSIIDEVDTELPFLITASDVVIEAINLEGTGGSTTSTGALGTETRSSRVCQTDTIDGTTCCPVTDFNILEYFVNIIEATRGNGLKRATRGCLSLNEDKQILNINVFTTSGEFDESKGCVVIITCVILRRRTIDTNGTSPVCALAVSNAQIRARSTLNIPNNIRLY